MGRKNYWRGASETKRNDSVFNPWERYKTTIYRHGNKKSGFGGNPRESQRSASNKYHGGGKKGGCYITSACVEARGLPDNCLELTTLREFRDNYLAHQENGKEMIQSYYNSAPRIVKAIDNSGDAKQVYSGLYGNLVQKCVGLIRKGDNKEALKNYEQIFQDLKRKYL